MNYKIYQSVKHAKAHGTRPELVMQIEVRTRMLNESRTTDFAQMMRDEINELTDHIYELWRKEQQ